MPGQSDLVDILMMQRGQGGCANTDRREGRAEDQDDGSVMLAVKTRRPGGLARGPSVGPSTVHDRE